MHLLLWRHAEAEDGDDDMKRRLTPRGHQQARAVAEWIGARGPKHLRILVSPADRAQETAAALERAWTTDARLRPSAGVGELAAASTWPGRADQPDDAVLLVGHQPVLGQLAAQLLAGSSAPWTIKKGALWWLSSRRRGATAETVLRAVIAPELLR